MRSAIFHIAMVFLTAATTVTALALPQDQTSDAPSPPGDDDSGPSDNGQSSQYIPNSQGNFICTQPGSFIEGLTPGAEGGGCDQYVTCVVGSDGKTLSPQYNTCPAGQLFNSNISACDDPANSTCNPGCPSGRTWNNSAQQCQCPSGQTWNDIDQECQ